MEWTGRIVHQRGWRYEVWTGLPQIVRDNLRFIASGRRPGYVDPNVLALLREKDVTGCRIGDAIRDIAESNRRDLRLVRAAAMVMLWGQEWVVDLGAPLEDSAVIQQVGGENHGGSGP